MQTFLVHKLSLPDPITIYVILLFAIIFVYRIIAINTLAIPAITYCFNIINWQAQEIKRIDTKIKKFLTANRMHHPKADVDRLYLPQSNGGRGLIQQELTLKTSTIGNEYRVHTKDWMLKLVLKHENTKNKYSMNHKGQ